MTDPTVATIPDCEQPLDWLSAALLAVAAGAVGLAVNIREGLFCRGAMLALTAAVAAVALAVCRPGWMKGAVRGGRFRGRLVLMVVLVCLAGLQFTLLFRQYPGTLWNAPPGSEQRALSEAKDAFTWIADPARRQAEEARIAAAESSLMDWRFRAGVLLGAALTGASLLPWRAVRQVALPLVLLTHLALGAWMLHRHPTAHIDVFVFQQESAAALLRGENPYATTFTNIYGEGAYVYAPDLMKDGRVNFGYPYPPLSLLMTLPGYVLTGDSRYSQLVAVTLAGALLMLARPGALSALAAALLLFTPRVFNIVELGWTEPFVVVLLAATVFSACRFPRAAPWVFGLLLASKQYMIFAAPLGALLLPRPFRWSAYGRFMLKAMLAACVVSLPLALWDLPAFWRSAVTLQLKQPFRNDSISYLAWLAWQLRNSAHGSWVPRLAPVAFIAAIGAVIVAIKRCPRGGAGFAAGVALVYLAFLSLNKQAFCNYYFFVIGALCAAVAMTDAAARSEARPVPPADAVTAPHPSRNLP